MEDKERQKALDTALSQIERQFGKGSVMKLGDEAAQPIAAIPTGALSLDLALGIGGVPRGRVVELYGPEASGKCLVADTLVWTDRGLETVGEVFARCGQKASCATRVTDVSDSDVRVVNERGELEPVAALTHNGRRPVVRLRLRSGREVSVTHNHPLRVVSERGYVVWRRAGVIEPGDTMVSALFGAVEAAGGSGLAEDEALLLGYLVAEGSLSNRSAVRFTNWDPEVGGEFTRLVEGLFGAEVRCYQNREYAVHDTALRARLAERYGLDYVTAHGKTVPACVRTSSHKVQRAFLSALFEGDGWIDGSSTVGLGTASETLARQVQLLLYGLGIPATVSSTFNATDERDSWSVTINPASVHRFLAEIGFRSARRQGQVDANFKTSDYDPRFENIPHLAGLIRDLRDDAGGDRAFDRIAGDLFREDLNLECSRARLIQIVEWAGEREESLSGTGTSILQYLRTMVEHRYTFEEVVAVEDAGEQPTFDLVVPGSHSFVANGVLSHNTTVGLHIIAEAQKLGGIAAFIDAEHALDPTYARALGVDINELLVSQPDTGEQALEIVDMLIRSGAVDLIVVDSVAALTPRAEIEGEMGDSHVGLQARLMSQAMRKLAGSLNRSRTCAVFINQIREKIGVMFGSPEVTPGGRALKFYSSVRIDVRRIESIKDGSDMVGNRVRAKLVKNKCVAVGTEVFDPTTGLTHRIEDIVDGGEGAAVWAADKAGRLHIRPILNRFHQGEREAIGLKMRDGTTLRVTPDHRVLTDRGWQQAGDLEVGDRLARPRRAGGFGEGEPVPPHHARMLGYLIGDGYVGGKTPVAFINTEEALRDDAAAIARELGCKVSRKQDGIYNSYSHRKGEKNELLELVRWAGLWGHLAPDKRIPPAFFAPDVSTEVVGNLLMGIWESDGWISREQTGGLRCGFVTTSEQLSRQIHWLLLRWGIGSSVMLHAPGSRRSLIDGRRVQGKLPCWQVRISGIDNVSRFAQALPMWGPKGSTLTEKLSDPALAKHRGSQRIYLAPTTTQPVLEHLDRQGVTPRLAAGLVGDLAGDPRGGMKQVLGVGRLRRDRLGKLAEALDDAFLHDVLDEDVWYDRIQEILPAQPVATYDIEVDEHHTFVADDVVISNCAPPFRYAEFDILYGEGISKEGAILDVGVDAGIIRKAGAWYSYEDDQLGQGRENSRQFLKDNPDIAREIEKRAKEELGITPLIGEAGEEEDPEVADGDEED